METWPPSLTPPQPCSLVGLQILSEKLSRHQAVTTDIVSIEATQRERGHGRQIHETLQWEICRLLPVESPMKTTTICHVRALLWIVTAAAFHCSMVQAQDETLATGWSVTDVGFGTKPSFDYDTSGRIHVMGMTEQRQGVVWYASAADGQGPWNPGTIDVGYFYGPGDLRVDSAGTAHVAWHDHDLQDATTVSITAEGQIRERRIESPGHDGWDNSLAFDSQGTLWQASVDPSGFGAINGLNVASLRGNQWESTNVEGSGSFMYGFNTSIAFDSTDGAHVLYTASQDWTDPGDLMHAYRIGEDPWQLQPVVTDGIRGRFPSLAFDAQGRGHAAWLDIDEDDPQRGTVRYGVLDEGIWSVSDVGQMENIELGFSGGRKQVSLALDSAGSPHVAFGDRRFVNYATYDGANWNTDVILEADGALYNGLVVLRVNPTNDQPGIVFWQDVAQQDGLVRILTMPTSELLGDVNLDGVLDAADIDLIRSAVQTPNPDPIFDVDNSGVVDIIDYDFWIADAKRTWQGDANLDGEFNSGDLVQVFASGEYEDGIPGNSSWTTGDWDGNFEFDSGDLVAAFSIGGYEQGPVPAAAASVPEPTSGLCAAALVAFVFIRANV